MHREYLHLPLEDGLPLLLLQEGEQCKRDWAMRPIPNGHLKDSNGTGPNDAQRDDAPHHLPQGAHPQADHRQNQAEDAGPPRHGGVANLFSISYFVVHLFLQKVALVGPNGRDTMREQLTRTGTKLLYDEEKLEKEHTW